MLVTFIAMLVTFNAMLVTFNAMLVTFIAMLVTFIAMLVHFYHDVSNIHAMLVTLTRFSNIYRDLVIQRDVVTFIAMLVTFNAMYVMFFLKFFVFELEDVSSTLTYLNKINFLTNLCFELPSSPT